MFVFLKSIYPFIWLEYHTIQEKEHTHTHTNKYAKLLLNRLRLTAFDDLQISFRSRFDRNLNSIRHDTFTWIYMLCWQNVCNNCSLSVNLSICAIQPSLLSAKCNRMINTFSPIKSAYGRSHLHISRRQRKKNIVLHCKCTVGE